MKKIILIFLLCFFISFLFSNENEQIIKNNFSLYLLIKGKLNKPIKRYDFAYRIEKAFPLRIKEFLLTSKYTNINNKKIQEIAETEILLKINPESRRKNAYYVTKEIFNYIKNEIEEDNFKEEVVSNSHSLFKFPSETIKERKGNLLEKCRLAVTLLRYLKIPARICFFENDYVVEYFMQPLKGKGNFFIMDFRKDDIEFEEEFIKPIEWFPVTKDELLNEEWKENEIFLKRINTEEIYFDEENDKKAKEIFEKVKNGEEIKGVNISKNFYLIRKVDYEIWLKKDKKAKVIFTLPFNNRANFGLENKSDSFRTMGYFLKSNTEELQIKYSRAYSFSNPPQIGIQYTLPVEFYIK